MMKSGLLIVAFVGIFGFGVLMVMTQENTVEIINTKVIKAEPTFIAGGNVPEVEEEVKVNPRVKISNTSVGYLNVRNGASVQSTKIGTVKPGEVYEYLETKDNWYLLVHGELEDAWVSGLYVEEVDRSEDLFQ